MVRKPGGLQGCLTFRLSSSRRGALAIFGGTAGGQALALVSVPVLTRLYSPANFGGFNVLSSLVAIVGTVAALRFELAVPLPEREQDAHGLVALGLMSTGLTFVLTSLVVALVLGKDADIVTLEQGMTTVVVAEAVIQSALTGRAVDLV